MKKLISVVLGLFNDTAPAIVNSNPLASLAIFSVKEAIKETPALVEDFKVLFASGTPTDADFDAFHAKVAGDSYAKLVPASQLPPSAHDLAVAEADADKLYGEVVPIKVIAHATPVPETTPSAAPVVCSKCNKELLPDHPENCNC